MDDYGRPLEPEIIDITPEGEERQARAMPRGPSRWALIWTLLKVMLLVSAPAALALWASAWLIQMGGEGQIFAWVLLILMAPITLGFTLVAIPLDLFLGVSVLAALFGRMHIATQFSQRAPGFRTVKDVFPLIEHHD